MHAFYTYINIKTDKNQKPKFIDDYSVEPLFDLNISWFRSLLHKEQKLEKIRAYLAV